MSAITQLHYGLSGRRYGEFAGAPKQGSGSVRSTASASGAGHVTCSGAGLIAATASTSGAGSALGLYEGSLAISRISVQPG